MLKCNNELVPDVQSNQSANDRRKKLYTQVCIRHADVPIIRELAYIWRRSRVDVLSTVLRMANTSNGFRPVQASVESWDRLDDRCRKLGITREQLCTRLIELVSRCSEQELLSLIDKDSTTP